MKSDLFGINSTINALLKDWIFVLIAGILLVIYGVVTFANSHYHWMQGPSRGKAIAYIIIGGGICSFWCVIFGLMHGR